MGGRDKAAGENQAVALPHGVQFPPWICRVTSCTCVVLPQHPGGALPGVCSAACSLQPKKRNAVPLPQRGSSLGSEKSREVVRVLNSTRKFSTRQSPVSQLDPQSQPASASVSRKLGFNCLPLSASVPPSVKWREHQGCCQTAVMLC